MQQFVKCKAGTVLANHGVVMNPEEDAVDCIFRPTDAVILSSWIVVSSRQHGVDMVYTHLCISVGGEGIVRPYTADCHKFSRWKENNHDNTQYTHNNTVVCGSTTSTQEGFAFAFTS